MSTSIRDIITEGLSRANIVNRKQPVPATMAESALRLLKGIAAKFSNDNLLQFLRREVEFTPADNIVSIGTGVSVNVTAEGMHTLTKLYIKEGSEYVELKFVSYEDFYDSSFGEYVYSYQPITDTYGNIYLKDRVKGLCKPLKAIYNVKWEFDLNTELHVPEQYVELFNAALAHKLTLTYPRLSSEQVALLKGELLEMVENVSVATTANKMIVRKQGRGGMSYNGFCNGDFL